MLRDARLLSERAVDSSHAGTASMHVAPCVQGVHQSLRRFLFHLLLLYTQPTVR